jgi:TolB-like protein
LNLSADPENEYFADGVTEDVIAQLSKIRSLKVISRSSVMRFKTREPGLREIGALLGVATVMDGSVRRFGDRVRIVAQLIDAEADRHLWTETYDRQLTDIFAIQTDVALSIATALEAELRPQERARIRREPTSNLQAYQWYLQGRACYIRYTQEIEYFEQAIEADPGFALAHTGLALAYAELSAGQGGGDLRPDLAYLRALEAVTHALAIDNELGEAHAVLALLKLVHDFDWAGAEAEFRRALELSPGAADTHDHYGWLCAGMERFDEAIALVRRAQELDPLAHRSDARGGAHRGRVRAGVRPGPLDPRLGLPQARPGGGRPRQPGARRPADAREYPAPRAAGAGLW